MTEKVLVSGICDDRFSSVKDTFIGNFLAGNEMGASLAVTINGKFVVDIWAGFADEKGTKPWQEDTIVNVYSTTKAMAALCILMLVDRNQLDLDAPVAKYWPEFGQAGKKNIPVRYLLSHTSGLAGFTESIPVEALYDWNKIIKLLAAQTPWWEPGTKSGYHSLTFGYPLGELVRRITGKTMGQFFRDEVAIPLGADFHIGLPEEHEPRVGVMIPPPVISPGEEGYIDPGSMMGKLMNNPPLKAEYSRDRAWRAAEIPAANGHGNARSVSRIGAAIACGGELNGIRLLSLSTIEKAIEEQIYDIDLALNMPIRWGLGFGLSSKEMPLGPNPRTFFWGGWGGSLMLMDLDAKISFSYVMNKMAANVLGDIRAASLVMALYASL
jgi:CubicO group peptidase (beta-lactamase class C family)